MRLSLLFALALPAVALSQSHDHGAPSAESHVMHEEMSGPMSPSASRHMAMTPSRPATHADSARASALVDTLRRAIAKYADTTAAVADGYSMFAPKLKTQKIYHFTNWRRAVKEAFRFNAGEPTSLLYRKGSDGHFSLVGAMYGAPKRTSVEELDRRVPLSMAHWHQHVNLCVPKKGQDERWMEKDRDGRMLFGPEGTIDTAQDCDKADGRFMDHLFGWMVHVNAMSSDPWMHMEHDH